MRTRKRPTSASPTAVPLLASPNRQPWLRRSHRSPVHPSFLPAASRYKLLPTRFPSLETTTLFASSTRTSSSRGPHCLLTTMLPVRTEVSSIASRCSKTSRKLMAELPDVETSFMPTIDARGAKAVDSSAARTLSLPFVARRLLRKPSVRSAVSRIARWTCSKEAFGKAE